MNKYNNIDDFIDAIVLNFDLNETTNKIVSKINSLRSPGRGVNLEIINNTIIWRKEGKEPISKDIEVDVLNNKIKVQETGIKRIEDGTRNYTNNFTYAVTNDKIVSHNYSRQYDIVNQNNNTLIKAEIKNTYNYYDNKKYLGTSYEKEEKTVLKDKTNITLENSDNIIHEVIYVLSTGDRLKIENINGEEKYYFYSKSQKADSKFFEEITKKDVDRLISKNSDDPYDIINDDTVYEKEVHHTIKV